MQEFESSGFYWEVTLILMAWNLILDLREFNGFKASCLNVLHPFVDSGH